ncbi:MAG: hypothetical protein RL033_4594 [Pseudomonadota bacterium]
MGHAPVVLNRKCVSLLLCLGASCVAWLGCGATVSSPRDEAAPGGGPSLPAEVLPRAEQNAGEGSLWQDPSRLAAAVLAPPCGDVTEPPPLVEVETTFELVPGTHDVVRVAADEQGLYWADRSGGIHMLPRDRDVSVTLRAAGPVSVLVVRMVTDDARVYWGEATDSIDAEGNVEGSYPPARLWGVSKHGGEPELMGEAGEDLMFPVAAMGPELLALSRQGLLYAFEAGSRRRVDHIPPAINEDLRWIDGRVFWTMQVGGDGGTDLYTAEAAGGEALRLLPGVPPDFLVNRGFLLWESLRLPSDYRAPVEYLSLLDLAAGCVRELPDLGQSVFTPLSDERHVYWRSGSGGAYRVSVGDPPPLQLPWVRADLHTGQLQRLSNAQLDATRGVAVPAAQDEHHLYLLLSVPGLSIGGIGVLRKPE